jgi:hypothetical protein
MTNTVNLESDLLGLTRKLNRDDIDANEYKMNAVGGMHVPYGNVQPFVDESRASYPAWMYRDLEQTRWEEPLLNPQANLEPKFHYNIQTRVLEKDYFTPSIPSVSNQGQTTADLAFPTYYLSGKSVCMGGSTDCMQR